MAFWDDDGNGRSLCRGFSRIHGSVCLRGHCCRGMRVYPGWLSGSLRHVSHLCQEKIFFQSLMNRIRGRLFLLSCHFCSFVLSLLVVPMESPWITPFFLPLFLAFSKPKLSVRASAQPSTFSLPQPGNIFHCSRQTLKNMTTPTLCISHSGCLGGVRQRPEAGSGGKRQPHPAGAQLGSQE